MKKPYILLLLVCSHFFIFSQTINLDIKVFLDSQVNNVDKVDVWVLNGGSGSQVPN